MPRKKTNKNKEINGGKIKSLKQIGRDIKKGFEKTISKPIEDKIINPASKKVFNPLMEGFEEIGKEAGKFTNEQLLPAVVSTGIPVASNVLGLLGSELGIPASLTSSITQGLLESNIPKKLQSKNKYVNMFADVLNTGLSGNLNPESMMDIQQKLMGEITNDLGINKPMPSKDAYNPDNPYQDLMLQLMMKYYPLDNSSPIAPPSTPQTPSIQETIDTNPNDDNDALYGNSELGEGADSIRNVRPPYQQKEGNATAMLGGGIKKKKGKKPKKIIIEEMEIYTKKKPSYKKFSHAKNSSLEQLLEANEEREEKNARKAMKEMVEKQTKYLSSLGYGINKKTKRNNIRM